MPHRKRFRRTDVRFKGVEQLLKAKSIPPTQEFIPGLTELLVKAGTIQKVDPFSVVGLIAKEAQRLDAENPTGPDEEIDPRIVLLLDLGSKIILEMDPIVRERCRDNPKALAEWEDIMKGLPKADNEDANESNT